MVSNKTAALLVSLFLVSIMGYAQKHIENSTSQTQQKIDTLVQGYYTKGELNGNILVMKDGKMLYKNALGYADGSKQTKLTEDFKFGIGSIYKEFPAVAIMQLQEADKIQLDDTIQQYLPDLPNWSKEITIKNLLQYTSGLPKINFRKYFSENKTIYESDVLQDIQHIETLEFSPGTDYLYSNNNPFLLIKIIEKVSGTTFNDYVQEYLFKPHGIHNTIIKNQYPYTDTTLMAIPMNTDFEEDQYKINIPTVLFSSTTEDLYHWVKALHSYAIINESSVSILSETATVGGSNVQAPLGNCVTINNKISEHIQHGSSVNYEGVIQHFPKEDLSIILLTNQKHQNVFEIAEKIKGIVEASVVQKE